MTVSPKLTALTSLSSLAIRVFFYSHYTVTAAHLTQLYAHTERLRKIARLELQERVDRGRKTAVLLFYSSKFHQYLFNSTSTCFDLHYRPLFISPFEALFFFFIFLERSGGDNLIDSKGIALVLWRKLRLKSRSWGNLLISLSCRVVTAQFVCSVDKKMMGFL